SFRATAKQVLQRPGEKDEKAPFPSSSLPGKSDLMEERKVPAQQPVQRPGRDPAHMENAAPAPCLAPAAPPPQPLLVSQYSCTEEVDTDAVREFHAPFPQKDNARSTIHRASLPEHTDRWQGGPLLQFVREPYT